MGHAFQQPICRAGKGMSSRHDFSETAVRLGKPACPDHFHRGNTHGFSTSFPMFNGWFLGKTPLKNMSQLG